MVGNDNWMYRWGMERRVNRQALVEQMMAERGLTWRGMSRQEALELAEDVPNLSSEDQDLLVVQFMLMAESGLPWTEAWMLSTGRGTSRFRASTLFSVLWMTAGLLFALVPGIVSQIVAPRWMVASSPDEAIGGATYLGLLALSGLAIAVIGLRFGLTGRSTEGWEAAVRMCVGVVFGTFISVMVLASGTMDLGLAATLLAMGISIPYWACAGLGLGLGSVLYRTRRS